MEQSALAHKRFAFRRKVIAADPIWQPVNMQHLLQMAVFGSAAAGEGDAVDEGDCDTTSVAVSDARSDQGLDVSEHVDVQSNSCRASSETPTAAQGAAAASNDMASQRPEKRLLLFRTVQATSVHQLSASQYSAAWLSLRTELLAVRLSRAWETRVPGWTLLYVFSALHALNITTQILTGVELRCPYTDPAGEWYWNFCTPQS
jgi:hypothetical protein